MLTLNLNSHNQLFNRGNQVYKLENTVNETQYIIEQNSLVPK